MESRLQFDMLRQPDYETCGPTCLHALYRFYNHEAALSQVIREVPRLKEGGTLAVLLANHALAQGFKALMYTYNLTVFDPTWSGLDSAGLKDRLTEQMRYKKSPKLLQASRGYLEFLDRGGRLRFDDLTPALVRKYLNRGRPILSGLSSTYLYRCMREYGPMSVDDDLRGEPQGHFVVLCGYDRETKNVLVADPFHLNPFARDQHLYEVHMSRVLCAILLGVLTFDANLLIIEPDGGPEKPAHE